MSCLGEGESEWKVKLSRRKEREKGVLIFWKGISTREKEARALGEKELRKSERKA